MSRNSKSKVNKPWKPKPKRVRDYKAEYARRQALARERGHRSYGEQRRKIERGEIPPIQPSRIRGKTRAAWFAALMDSPQRADQHLFVRREIIADCEEWSRLHAMSDRAKFRRKRALKDQDYLMTYYRAFIMNTTSDFAHLKDNQDLKKWFMQFKGMSEDEYRKRYPRGGRSSGR